MKFIVDAQLPVSLSKFFQNKGFDAIHTDDLPNKELTTDNEIRDISLNESRIIITKDSDFLDSYYVKGIPEKLLLVTTGNIKNKELLRIFELNLDEILRLFIDCSFVEIDNFEISGHE
jgi:predicted nuclease of predicted toxin-antitoxin system